MRLITGIYLPDQKEANNIKSFLRFAYTSNIDYSKASKSPDLLKATQGLPVSPFKSTSLYIL